jgi:elongation factor 1-alpha
MPWYKGWKVPISKTDSVEGYTLYDALEKMVRPPKRNLSGPVRAPVNGIYKIKGVGDIITARIEQGVLKKDDIVGFAPRKINGCKVFSIEMHHKQWDEARPGDNVGLSIKGLDKKSMPKAGDVIYLDKEGILTPVKSFTAQVSVQEHPGQLKAGFSPIIHVRTAKGACKMTAIHWKMNKKSGNEKLNAPQFIERNDNAEVTFEPLGELYLEEFNKCPGLGRVAVMDSNNLVMLGKVTSVVYK